MNDRIKVQMKKIDLKVKVFTIDRKDHSNIKLEYLLGGTMSELWNEVIKFMNIE